MLSFYRDDIKVKHISGCNFIGDLNKSNAYGFSNFASIWGWATWKRAWQEYNFELPIKDNVNFKEKLFSYFSNDYNQLFFWTKGFGYASTNDYDSWDFQWQISIWLNQGVCIYPTRNLIKNIGFHENALHTKNISSPLSNLPLNTFQKKNLKKQKILVNSDFDDFIFYYVHKEIFDLTNRKVLKLKIAIEPTLFQTITERKFTLRDKLYLIREHFKKKIK